MRRFHFRLTRSVTSLLQDLEGRWTLNKLYSMMSAKIVTAEGSGSVRADVKRSLFKAIIYVVYICDYPFSHRENPFCYMVSRFDRIMVSTLDSILRHAVPQPSIRPVNSKSD